MKNSRNLLLRDAQIGLERLANPYIFIISFLIKIMGILGQKTSVDETNQEKAKKNQEKGFEKLCRLQKYLDPNGLRNFFTP